MPQQISPRGTFLAVADALKVKIANDRELTELPTIATVMGDHGVSRGVVIRAFEVLVKEGRAEKVRGGRHRVVRHGQHVDRRPLAERLVDVFEADALEVGEPFPSASDLSQRFGVSRPTVGKALDKLEAAGLLTEARQGKPRTVRALPPDREERSEP